jgi:protein TonB
MIRTHERTEVAMSANGTTERNPVVRYGAIELQAVYQRNFFVACFIATVIHVGIAETYACWLRNHPEPPVKGGGRQHEIDFGYFRPGTSPALPTGWTLPVRGTGSRGVRILNTPANPVPVPDTSEVADTVLWHDGSGGPVDGDGDGRVSEGSVGDGEVFREDLPPEFQDLSRDPVLIRTAIPAYPEAARLAGLEGTVVVKLLVDKSGNVRQATVDQSTLEILNDAALEAAQRCVFRPGYMTGGPVSAWVRLPFRFRINTTR